MLVSICLPFSASQNSFEMSHALAILPSSRKVEAGIGQYLSHLKTAWNGSFSLLERITILPQKSQQSYLKVMSQL